MRTLDYQERVMKALDTYLAELKTQKAKADQVEAVAAANPGIEIPIPDFAAATWEELRKQTGFLPTRLDKKTKDPIPFSERKDGIGRSVPNITLKVPTGGGKTYLAVNSISRILGSYIGSNSGFVLWIVPNEAIYTQTLRRLKDRQDPYRQVLDRAAAGRVKIMEKNDRLDRRDIDANLCVMVLMLQSANRETQDSLKMFRDRGDVHGFTPIAQQDKHAELLEAIPNLSTYDHGDAVVPWAMVKDSLGNALRIIRPIVVVDEGQKAVSELAFKTLYGFNPSFVLELTATPKDVAPSATKTGRYANLLVEVTGKELDQEGMIKMPLNLDPRQSSDWHSTLDVGVTKLREVQAAAEAYEADGGDYIRPIMLVQVERTGDDQREGGFIHALDVMDRLKQLGFDEAEVAIKTAQRNDLKEPENQDLLSPTNRVRVIITKQALQEGWDCPFAYVLCSLAASSNMSAMTQLVGRILRQPYAHKTDVPILDECHVVTHHAGTSDVIKAIKDGLEKDGLSDLVVTTPGGEGSGSKTGIARDVARRDIFDQKDIYLPKVLWVEASETRDFDYDTDLLSQIDWTNFKPDEMVKKLPANPTEVTSQLQRFSLSGPDGKIVNEDGDVISESMVFDPVFVTRSISDIVPNAFTARGIVSDLLVALDGVGYDAEKRGKHAGLILTELRKALEAMRSATAEALFRSLVGSGEIQFRLRVDGRNWQMPSKDITLQPSNSAPLLNDKHQPMAKSLFELNYRADFNDDEAKVAVHLDGAATVTWWHRNVARHQYGLQGWRRGRIYPDFVFAASTANGGKRLVALETKGDQLAGNLDTAYKKSVLDVLTDGFAWEHTPPAGQMQLVNDDGSVVECALVLMSDIDAKLPDLIDP
ncbi:DEAD/DEAH box helicase [Mangrovicoccus algicola]|uniref:DEAD/DEAH box helicase family protein n=1 Tax=Mangrovicoccus algicola TaxID=2771008 RepID=A0A8J6YVZ1_9RHOB|nr:DEAD/DEAH box helicase family protein [Mangrovicoccus algicola]MBE3637219.1 DEAD/DEAH box helicase family protein [Mangrovicoccus algicola]